MSSIAQEETSLAFEIDRGEGSRVTKTKNGEDGWSRTTRGNLKIGKSATEGRLGGKPRDLTRAQYSKKADTTTSFGQLRR